MLFSCMSLLGGLGSTLAVMAMLLLFGLAHGFRALWRPVPMIRSFRTSVVAWRTGPVGCVGRAGKVVNIGPVMWRRATGYGPVFDLIRESSTKGMAALA